MSSVAFVIDRAKRGFILPREMVDGKLIIQGQGDFRNLRSRDLHVFNLYDEDDNELAQGLCSEKGSREPLDFYANHGHGVLYMTYENSDVRIESPLPTEEEAQAALEQLRELERIA